MSAVYVRRIKWFPVFILVMIAIHVASSYVAKSNAGTVESTIQK